MTCICGHIKAEHLLTGQCYQCDCQRYELDIKADRELIESALRVQLKRMEV